METTGYGVVAAQMVSKRFGSRSHNAMINFFNRIKVLIATSLLAMLMSIVSPTFDIPPAHADFRICNDTKSLVGAALGYQKEETWISEGWFQLQAESCASLVEGDLSSQFYYIYAEDSDRGGQWRGDIFLCTNEREFKIEGVQDCFKRGHVKTGFFEINTGNRANWMVRLTEQSQSPPGQ